jgi:hypothetical protein
LFARHLFVTVKKMFVLWGSPELVMAAAVLTPRVRLMTVCDGVRESKTEAGVFHVKGLRQRIVAPAFPFLPPRLWLFLVLSSHRSGKYPGYIRVLNDRTDKAIFHWRLAPVPTFGENDEVMTCSTWIRCAFPEPGRYTVQVWFFQEQGSDVLKGEMPFSVTSEGA